MYCPKCGAHVPDGNIYCYGCGAKIHMKEDGLPREPGKQTPQKNEGARPADRQASDKPKAAGMSKKTRVLIVLIAIAVSVYLLLNIEDAIAYVYRGITGNGNETMESMEVSEAQKDGGENKTAYQIGVARLEDSDTWRPYGPCLWYPDIKTAKRLRAVQR
ncbi:MAG: zinc ribbon domain-containing protein [Eubacteriales bacterium]|nr:zinc ribbon domain-containing protein [Eubacteriales bacterium]